MHADFFGPIKGIMYLIITYVHSKFVGVSEMRNITAKSTIQEFEMYFDTWGLAVKIVSDNGPAFIADEFAKFLRINNIEHVLIPPYNPPSNGAAENAVKTFKSKFKLFVIEKINKRDALSKCFFQYRSTPQVTTEVTWVENSLQGLIY